MKIGIFGDIHGNIDALTAVLDAFGHADVDRMLCTGDVVGYGACPKECIDIVRELDIPTVRGNHDEYTTEFGGDWRIREEAKHVIRWNQQQLPPGHIEWLAKLPRSYVFEDFIVVHSSLAWCPDWPYVLNQRTAIHSFLFQDQQLCFNGHSHVPICARHQDGTRPQIDLLRNFFVPRTQKVLIGVGSVGQPRDGDPRSCAVIYDTEQKSIRLLRIPYDVEAAQARIFRAGLPESLALRLAVGE